MNNKTLKLVLALSLVILTLNSATAFANTYLENKTLEIYPWDTGKYCIYLQNTGNEDSVQKISINEGEEYIKNLDEVVKEFNVSAGTLSNSFPVCMELKLPSDFKEGEKYAIGYGVAYVTSDEQKGMVSFAPIQITEKFYITEKIDRETGPYLIYLVIISFAVITGLVAVISAVRKRKLAIRKKKKLSGRR